MDDVAPPRPQIYEELFDAATPLSADQPAPAARVRRLLELPSATLAGLRERYEECELIAAGVAVRDANEELIPAPSLSGPPVELIALRAARDEFPYDLLTQAGCLSDRLPTTAMLQDFRLRAQLADSHGYLFLAFVWADFTRLDDAGLAVAYSPAASTFSVPTLRQMAADLASLTERSAGAASRSEHAPADEPGHSAPAAISSEPDAANADGQASADLDGAADAGSVETPVMSAADDDSQDQTDELGEAVAADGIFGSEIGIPPTLVVVAWSPATGSRAATLWLERQLEELRRFEEALPLALPDLLVWLPAEQGIAELELLARYADAVELRLALIASVEADGRRLGASNPPSADSYLAARTEYRQAVVAAASRGDDGELSTKRQAYQRSLEAELIQPLLEDAMCRADPAERARYAATCELCDRFFNSAPLAAAEACLAGAAQPARGDGAAGASLRDYLALAKVTMAALKGLR